MNLPGEKKLMKRLYLIQQIISAKPGESHDLKSVVSIMLGRQNPFQFIQPKLTAYLICIKILGNHLINTGYYNILHTESNCCCLSQ